MEKNNWDIKKHTGKYIILTCVPNTESCACRSPISVIIKIKPIITRVVWTIIIISIISECICCSFFPGQSNIPIVGWRKPYRILPICKHWWVVLLAINKALFKLIISINKIPLSIGIIFCRVPYKYFRGTRSWNIFEFETNNKIKQNVTYEWA